MDLGDRAHRRPSPPLRASRKSDTASRGLDSDSGRVARATVARSTPGAAVSRASSRSAVAPLEVSGDVVPLGGEIEPSPRVAAVARRCEPDRRSASSAAAAARHARLPTSPASSRIAAISGVRLGRREGEVPRALLLRRDELREPCVERSPARRRLAGGDGRAEEGMGEAEPLAVELEDARLDGLGETRVGRTGERGLDELRGRIRRRQRPPAPPRSHRCRDRRGARARARPASRGSGAGRRERASRRVARSAIASSRAKNGLPPDVSQSRISVGRGKPEPSRLWSSSLEGADAQPFRSRR